MLESTIKWRKVNLDNGERTLWIDPDGVFTIIWQMPFERYYVIDKNGKASDEVKIFPVLKDALAYVDSLKWRRVPNICKLLWDVEEVSNSDIKIWSSKDGRFGISFDKKLAKKKTGKSYVLTDYRYITRSDGQEEAYVIELPSLEAAQMYAEGRYSCS